MLTWLKSLTKKLLLTLIFSVFLLSQTCFLAYADKGVIPIGDIPIYEPSQKAIVAWNGEKEILILSVDLKTLKGKTPVLEVLPLPSKPEIEEASPKSFDVLLRYFRSKRVVYGKGLAGVEGVEVVFHEKIGVHDVTVVRVKDTKDFIRWVEDFTGKHGLPKPNLEKVLSLVNDYTKRGFEYFVFDLVNVGENIKTVKPLMYKFDSKEAYFPLKISSIAKGKTSITVFLLTSDRIRFPATLPANNYMVVMRNKIIPLKVVAEADKRIANLFQPNQTIRFSVITYRGSLQNLKEDLLLKAWKWTLYKPNPEQVKISIEKTKNGETLAKVSITFKSGDFHVDWGTLKKENSVFSVDAKVEAWEGPAIQVITVESSTYNLGFLRPGHYTFIFKVNGENVKTVEFEVTSSQIQPLALTDVTLNLILAVSFVGLVLILVLVDEESKNF
ncbi:MAG: hypothetical protein DRO36_00630 [Candidatus Hecatellales archaeon]|nr:MAG: hypothetical protein DRO36_00630 [Candidatus Hecatellales archaeon]